MKRFALINLLMLLVVFAMAQTLDYPVVTVNGKKYYSYTVEPKDGLFGIARKFGVSQADLHECNDNLSNDLKIGQTILVPVVENVPVQTDVIIHEVQPKETLYALSHKYNVSVESLIQQNPILANGLKVGQKLRIPKTSTVEENTTETTTSQTAAADTTPVQKHVVKKGETLYSISHLYSTTVEELVDANNIHSAIKVGDELIIPNQATNQTADNYVAVEQKHTAVVKADSTKHQVVVKTTDSVAAPQDTHHHHSAKPAIATNSNALKVAVLMPFMLKTPYIDASVNYFWEFYRGMLIGLEDVKQSGISVDLRVYDIEKSLETLDSVLALSEMTDVDLIIGPAYSNQVSTVAAFAKQHKIYTIVPFTSKLEDANEYMIQFNPSQEKVLPVVAQTIAKRFSSQNFVIARISDKRDKANMLADELTKVLHKMHKTYKEISLSVNNVDTLNTVVGRNRALLLIATTRPEVVAGLLPRIKELSLPFMQIFGFEDWKQWLSYQDGTYYYSLFNRHNTESYEQNYKKWFGEHTVDIEPHYDLIGYDIVNYLLPIMSTNKSNPTMAFDKAECNCLQSEFSFEKGSEGQWINTNWYLFGYYNKQINEVK